MSNSYGGYGLGSYGASRFDERTTPFSNTYATPGWQRATGAYGARARRCAPRPISSKASLSPAKPKAAASSAVPASSTRNSATAASRHVDGNKLTIDFDKAGEKRVLDSFVEPA